MKPWKEGSAQRSKMTGSHIHRTKDRPLSHAGLKSITVASPFPEERDAFIQSRHKRGSSLLLQLSPRCICSRGQKDFGHSDLLTTNGPVEPGYLYSRRLLCPLSDKRIACRVTLTLAKTRVGVQAIRASCWSGRVIEEGRLTT